MSDFVLLMQNTFSALSTFLMSEPIKYIIGLVILAFIVRIFVYIAKSSIRSI